MFSGFKEFVLRGNIVDLAVAVVIGTAFATVVSTVVSSVITPLLAATGGVEAPGLGILLVEANPATFIDLGAVINSIIVFLITAAVVYFAFVAPMNTLAERRARGVEPEPEAPTEDVVVLREIRDLLSQQRGRHQSDDSFG